MQNITCVLLIDKRLANYDEIIASANAVTACVVFDYDLDTFDTLKTRGIDRITSENRVVCTWIAIDAVEPEPATEPKQQVCEYRNIGLMQHNTNSAQYFVTASEPGCQLDNVAESDPSLTTWANYIDFVNKCVRDYGMQTYDMMACALYSNANWKYAIDEMAARCGVSIRASLDNTGAAALGGNWFLELGGVNLKDVYFTDAIDDYNGLLAQTRISIPDFYASYGMNTSVSNIAKDGWVIYSSVGTYHNEGLASLIKTSGSYIVGFITDKVTIGITGPTPFKIDSISWGGNSLSTRTAKTVKIYGSNTSYLENISSSIISNNATLIATHQIQQVLEQTISINSTLYSSYYFDVLDNWGDASIKISGIVFNPGAPSNTVMADYTMSSTVYESTFTSHTFTNAGATGRTGPILSAVRTAYSTAVWAQDTTNNWLNMSTTGIQEWTVPKTGNYTIRAVGAAGGSNDPTTMYPTTNKGGRGIIITTTTFLTKGTTLKILVGQTGSISTGGISSGGGGGGGGTYVYVDNTTKIIIAGGGGGAGGANDGRANGSDASSNVNPTYPKDINGNIYDNGFRGEGNGGGNAGGSYDSAGGAGFNSNGLNSINFPGTTGGLSPENGGTGGNKDVSRSPYATTGGFGGGGGANDGGGGGGGWSGGNSGKLGGSLVFGGGGGGSYAISTMTVNGYNADNGSVTITLLLTSPATLAFTKTAFYAKYLLNSTISIPATLISTNNSDSYTVAHSSGNASIATVTTAANVGTVTVKGLGTTTITSTLAATTNFDAVTVTSITITVIGSGSTLTGATMTSVDLTSTDLTGSVFSGCDLTSANLYGATFNAATDLRGSTLTSLKSGRINGFTTLLPTGYKMI